MRLSANGWILTGLAAGAVGGTAANLLWPASGTLQWLLTNLSDTLGQVFLRLLLMVVVPLVFSTLTVGMATFGGAGSLGRAGGKTLGLFLALAFAGAWLGIGVSQAIRPGDFVTDAMRATIGGTLGEPVPAASLGVSTLVNIVPTNPVAAAAGGDLLGFLVFTLLFGAALAMAPPRRVEPLVRLLDSVAEATGQMVRFAMKLAPLGVTALAFSGFARFGLDFARPIGVYLGVVLGGLLLLQFVLYAVLVRYAAGASPRWFYSRGQPAMVTALATASSNATLPTTLRVAQEGLGVASPLAGFVVPLGASLSRGGTALFQAATAVFLAQALGIDLGPPLLLLVAVMATATAVAAGGIPSGALPLLASVVAVAGVPAGAIALMLGVEPILSMARTVPNVTGALVTALLLDRGARPVPEAPGRDRAAPALTESGG